MTAGIKVRIMWLRETHIRCPDVVGVFYIYIVYVYILSLLPSSPQTLGQHRRCRSIAGGPGRKLIVQINTIRNWQRSVLFDQMVCVFVCMCVVVGHLRINCEERREGARKDEACGVFNARARCFA